MSSVAITLPPPYNPNTFDVDVEQAPAGVANWPVFPHAHSVEDYTNVFAKSIGSLDTEPGSLTAFFKATIETAKASPPDLRSMQQMNVFPDPQGKNILPVPGMSMQMIKMLAEQHLSPKMIIGLRVADIMRYSSPSTRPWMPGWVVETKKGVRTPTDQDDTDKDAAIAFLENCSINAKNARDRDAKGLTSFSVFLETAVRDSLIYGAYSWWTDCDLAGRPKAFKALSSYNVRLTTKEGYNNNPAVFAVGVDDMNKVQAEFTRFDLVYQPRNPRAETPYGAAEIELGIKLIQGWSDALDLNLGTFNKNAIPPGILTVSGNGWTQKQLDVLSRIWTNLKRGVSKSHALPVIPLPKDGKLELMSLDTLIQKDTQFSEFLNMLAGTLCAVYRFPPSRLGVFASGKSPDNRPDDKVSQANVDIADPGLAPLLFELENLINEYLIYPRWPHLRFSFSCKNPKDDARAYEMRVLAMTQDERRAFSDLPTLETIAKPEDKDTARLMGMAPVDPGMVSLYGNIVTAKIAAESADKTAAEKPEGAAFPSKTDPAKSEEHGHTSGVRRDSATERDSAEK